ncbi:MAG: class I SAM-dependent methyltransferase [Fibrobacterota bacterium]
MISWDDYWKNYSISKAERWIVRQRHEVICGILDKMTEKPVKVLEIGCGFGSNLRLIKADREDAECTALDNSPVAIEKISEEIPDAVTADCCATGLPDNTYDLIYSSGLMEHFRDETPLIRESRRILKEGGILLTFVPGKISLWQLYRLLHFGNWKHGYEKSYTASSLKNIFTENGFEIEFSGGNDPFSINGFIMKALNVSYNPLFGKSILPSGYSEIYTAARKKSK